MRKNAGKGARAKVRFQKDAAEKKRQKRGIGKLEKRVGRPISRSVRKKETLSTIVCKPIRVMNSGLRSQERKGEKGEFGRSGGHKWETDHPPIYPIHT